MSVKLLLSVSVSAVLLGCGGSGGSDAPEPAYDPSQRGPIAGPLMGQFGERGYANVPYSTLNGYQGITSSRGEFYYDFGDTITFTVRGAATPTVLADSKVTIRTFDDVTPTDSQDLGLNIATLLHSLDVDGDASNGVSLPTETSAMRHLGAGVNFNQSRLEFAADPATQAAFTQGDSAPMISTDVENDLNQEMQSFVQGNNGHWQVFAIDGTADRYLLTFNAAGTANYSNRHTGSWLTGPVPAPGSESVAYSLTWNSLSLGNQAEDYRLVYEGHTMHHGQLADVLIYAQPGGKMLYLHNAKGTLNSIADSRVTPPRAWYVIDPRAGHRPEKAGLGFRPGGEILPGQDHLRWEGGVLASDFLGRGVFDTHGQDLEGMTRSNLIYNVTVFYLEAVGGDLGVVYTASYASDGSLYEENQIRGKHAGVIGNIYRNTCFHDGTRPEVEEEWRYLLFDDENPYCAAER